MKKVILGLVGMAALVATLSASVVDTQKCTGCHGLNFGKKALGKSVKVNEMKGADIMVALKGYQDGTYGGKMKGLMKAQLKGYDETDLESICKQIVKIGGAE